MKKPTTILATSVATAVAAMLLTAPPAAADGAGCKYRTVDSTWTNVQYGELDVDIRSTSTWQNCNTHTHPKQVGITFTFEDDDADRDWKYDEDDDYITYECVVKTDNRVADKWTGRLDWSDRSDGHTVSDQSLMYYNNDPRVVCTGTVHRDYESDWDFRYVGRPL